MQIRFKSNGFLTWVTEFGAEHRMQVNSGEVYDVELEETNDGILLTDLNGFHALVNASALEQVG
jgi:hypothetical protein